MSQLFVLSPASHNDEDYALIDESRPAWETVQCSVFRTVETRRIGPLVVSEVPLTGHGVIWTWYLDVLVRDFVKGVIESCLSGCSFVPAEIGGDAPPQRARLWELHTNGFAGFAAGAGDVNVRSRCDECGIYSYTTGAPFSQLIDPAKRDGSDVFTIWPFPRIHICTEKAASVLRRSDVDGIAIIPIEEFELVSASAAPGLPAAYLDSGAQQRLMNDPDFINAIWPS